MTCSCGTPAAHEIARRMTSDGKAICFWSDGGVTAPLGIYLPGVGARKLPEGAASALQSEVCVLAAWEVGPRFLAYHKAAKNIGDVSEATYREAWPATFAGHVGTADALWQRTRAHIVNCRKINCRECM